MSIVQENTPNNNYPSRNWLHRILKAFGARPIGSWIFARILYRLDNPVMKLTRGRTSVTSMLAGLPMMTLVSMGARSGQTRINPLTVLTDGDKRIIIGSNFGQSHNPGWYYNLKANPKAKLSHSGEMVSYIARQAEGDEREIYLQTFINLYHGYANYEKRASHRHIPVMVLEKPEAD